MRKRLERLERRFRKTAPIRPPGDIVEFCRLVGFKPKRFQERVLRDWSKRITVLFGRQMGKSTCLALKAVYFALSNPGTTTLILCPVYRQTLNLGDKVVEVLNNLPQRLRSLWCLRIQKLQFYFRNLSRLILLSALSMDKLRGYTAHMILVDEAAFIPDDEKLFVNILLPMLSTTDGWLIVSSTPWGRDTMFYRFCHSPGWSHHVATWRDAVEEGLYSRSFVETDLKALMESNPQQFRIEYECQFIPDLDSWLTQDLIARCVDGGLEYVDYGTRLSGSFWIGVDLGKHRDHSAVAVLSEDEDGVLRLIHLKRFPLETPYASVIGYLKGLCDTLEGVNGILIDQTGVGEYVVEDALNVGLPAEGVVLTVKTKEQIMTYLKTVMARGMLRYPYDRMLLHELNVEKFELSKSGYITFTHPEGTHDDRLWALALAVYASRKPGFAVTRGRRVL